MSESMLTAVPTPAANPRPADEVPELRSALESATRVLDAVGITPEAYAALDPASRDTTFWTDARRVWAARTAVAAPDPERCVLRLSRGAAVSVRAFASADEAIDAAIGAIEINEAYPSSIERDGVVLFDRAEILRLWEERHMPG